MPKNVNSIVKIFSYIATALGAGVVSTIVVALIFEKRLPQNNSIGTVLIDERDPDGPYLFLEVNKGKFDILKSQSKATFDVKMVVAE